MACISARAASNVTPGFNRPTARKKCGRRSFAILSCFHPIGTHISASFEGK